MEIEPMVDDLSDVLFIKDYEKKKLFGIARVLESHSLVIVKLISLMG